MAAGYGVGQVTIGPTLAGHVAVTNVTAVHGLSPRIRFGLSWTLGHLRRSGKANPPRDEYFLIDFGGELWVGADDLFVGTLVRDGSRHPLRSLDHVQTQEGSVALGLGGHRLERLEEHRAGGILAMNMQLWPRIEVEGTTIDARVSEIPVRVPRDDWLTALGTLTGEQIDLLEIRYHLAYADRYGSSLAELRRARDAVDRGDFNHAVLQARKAVTLMEGSVGDATGDGLKTALTDRLDKRHVELYAGVVKRAKEMGNIAAHRPGAREYTRVEALFAIRLATITLEVVAGLLSGGERTHESG